MVRRITCVNGIRVVLLALMLSSWIAAAGCAGQAADRLYREAAQRVEKGDLEGAVELFDRIVREHPQTEAAEKARADVVLYRGLFEASQKFPTRRATDLVVQVARALERHRHAKGAAPASLADLVPGFLDAEPEDPWGRKLLYRPTPVGGYVLSCLGSDGREGGEGQAADLVVRDGKFVSGEVEAQR